MSPINLKNPDNYINRELSLIEYHRRILEQAKDARIPLLERLRFLCILSINFDEFFEIRVSGLKQKKATGAMPVSADYRNAPEILLMVNEKLHGLVNEQYRVLNDALFPALTQQGIRFIRRSDWTKEQEQWLRNYFNHELLPILSPIGLDSAHPFPRILNKSLTFIVSLLGKDAFGRTSGMAVVQAPRLLPRLIQLPPQDPGNGPADFVFLSSVIHAFVSELFPGMKVKGCYQFRVTRNSELYVDEEEVDDLLRAVEGELLSRRYGEVVRIEITDDCTPEALEFLTDQFSVTEADVYRVNGPVNLNRLVAVYDLVDRPELKYAPFVPKVPATVTGNSDVFEAMRESDILLHHPFESFVPVIDFLRQASCDPQVLAIKQTLYRTGPDSAVVDALVQAARNGKEVTVAIELRARFDEEANIKLANRLQEAGAHVVYGVVGYKTHAKIISVVRREGKQLRYYVHLGTGNYHPRTTRLYTDYGLLTCDPDFGEDVHKVFLQLTSLGKVSKLSKLLQAPFSLHDVLIKKIEREASNAKAEKKARIIVKVNSLVESRIIQALYKASMDGVCIDLIVRGVCCLRPGQVLISENIRVRSIIGRFLEHARVYYFENGGNPEIYCASADWMERNFFRRVEIAFPIERKPLRARIIAELEYYLKDNTHAWLLQADGSYVRSEAENAELFSAQQALLDSLTDST